MAPWTNQPNGTMLAAVLRHPGAHPPSSCFEITEQYPKPSLPSSEWLLVRVKACGLNRAELRGRNNEPPALPEHCIFQKEFEQVYADGSFPSPPSILGEEFVGVIEDLGSEAKARNFALGGVVAGAVYGGGKAYDGSYAQYTVCHWRRCWKLPETKLSWDVLAAIPMSMWTAWGSLFEAGQLRQGQTLLVHGGSSSVGVWAAYLAKDRGCQVITTTRSAEKLKRLAATGADHVILEHQLEEKLPVLAPKGVDVILELVGASALESFTLRHLARYGTVVVTGVLNKSWKMDQFSPLYIPTTRKVSHYTLTDAGLDAAFEDEDARKVEQVLDYIVRGAEEDKFKPEVFLDRVFELKDVGKAHEWMEDNAAVGKVVLVIP